MLYITSGIHGVLAADEDCKFYKRFVEEYAILAVTSLVSQGMFIARDGSNAQTKELENDLDYFIQTIPNFTNMELTQRNNILLSVGMVAKPLPQQTESRALEGEFFTNTAKKTGLNNREFILSHLNKSAFLSYFTLIEKYLNEIYRIERRYNGNLRAGELISKQLKSIIKKHRVKDSFNSNLRDRSQIFANLEMLEKLWRILNTIRNILVHNNGYLTNKNILDISKKYKDFYRYYIMNSNDLISIMTLSSYIAPIYRQLIKDKYILVNNLIENVMRNTAVIIMECLYLTKILHNLE